MDTRSITTAMVINADRLQHTKNYKHREVNANSKLENCYYWGQQDHTRHRRPFLFCLNFHLFSPTVFLLLYLGLHSTCQYRLWHLKEGKLGLRLLSLQATENQWHFSGSARCSLTGLLHNSAYVVLHREVHPVQPKEEYIQSWVTKELAIFSSKCNPSQ